MDSTIENYISTISKNTSITRKKYYEKAFLLVNEWLKENNILAFGGYTLNELLPSTKKIYSESEIYDIDCYSSNPINHAKILVKKMEKNGYFYNQISKGLNNNVYKVFIDFVNIVDISFIPKNIYKQLYNISLIDYKDNPEFKKGIKYIPLSFLFYSFNREFSSPSADFRWAKVYSRYSIFRKHYSETNKILLLSAGEKGVSLKDKNNGLIANILKYVKEKSIPITGTYAVTLLTGGKIACNCTPYISVYSDEPKKLLNDIKKDNHMFVFTWKETEGAVPTYVNKYIQVFIQIEKKQIEVLRILDNTGFCFSTIKKNGFVINTVTGILANLYAQYIWEFNKTYNSTNNTCVVKNLDNADLTRVIDDFEKWANANKMAVNMYMNVNCYGSAKRYLSLKKDNWDDDAIILKSNADFQL